MDQSPPRGEARTRILETTWALIAAEGAAVATLVRVAREAGVSRQAVYLFFGNRAGLLDQALRWHDETSGIRTDLRRAAIRRPTREALVAVVDVWFAYLPRIEPVARPMEAAAAAADPDAACAWENRLEAIRSLHRAVLRRIAREGDLVPGWLPDDAADFAYALTHPGTWRRLVIESGWSHDRAVASISTALSTTLLTPAATLKRE